MPPKSYLTTISVSVNESIREEWEDLSYKLVKVNKEFATKGEFFAAMINHYKELHKK